MTYKTKCKADGSCVERIDSQAESIKSYQDEINRLRDIVNKKEKAMAKAVSRITRLEGEKRELTVALNITSRELEYYKADYKRHPHPNMRTDQNWDSRPREERSDESHIEITEQGICAINGEDPNKQVKFGHDGGESTIIVTDDNWESSETLYKG